MEKKSKIRLAVIISIGVVLIAGAFVVVKKAPDIFKSIKNSKAAAEYIKETINPDPKAKEIYEMDDDKFLKAANEAFVSKNEEYSDYLNVLIVKANKIKSKILVEFLRDNDNDLYFKYTLVSSVYSDTRGNVSRSKNNKIIALLDEEIDNVIKEIILSSADFDGKENVLKRFIDLNDEKLSLTALSRLKYINKEKAIEISDSVISEPEKYCDGLLWTSILIKGDKIADKSRNISEEEKQQLIDVCVETIKTHEEKSGIAGAADMVLSELITESEKKALLGE